LGEIPFKTGCLTKQATDAQKRGPPDSYLEETGRIFRLSVIFMRQDAIALNTENF
jgi:hypothetical protein